MNTPARVVLLLQDLAVGGTQRQAVELAVRLDRSRFAPELWTLMAGDGMVRQAQLEDVPVRRLSPLPFVGPDAIVRLGWELVRQEIEVVVLLTAVPNVWGRLLGRAIGQARQALEKARGREYRAPAILATCRGGGAPMRQHEKRLWRWADLHVSNTQAMKDVLVRDYGVPEEHIRVVHNGVDVQRFQPRPAGDDKAAPTFLHLARLVEDKDHATSLQAFASLLDSHPTATLRIVGDGARRGELKSLAGELFSGNRRQQVHFEGERLDVEAVLQSSDILVLSSIREAMPNVILEAMATGLPVISTHVGGIAEMVAQGETGLLTPAGDAQAMAEAMKGLASSPARRAAMGEAGRKRVEAHFSFEAMTRGHEAIFAHCLEQRG